MVGPVPLGMVLDKFTFSGARASLGKMIKREFATLQKSCKLLLQNPLNCCQQGKHCGLNMLQQ
jgi:hypothetical protein